MSRSLLSHLLNRQKAICVISAVFGLLESGTLAQMDLMKAATSKTGNTTHFIDSFASLSKLSE